MAYIHGHSTTTSEGRLPHLKQYKSTHIPLDNLCVCHTKVKFSVGQFAAQLEFAQLSGGMILFALYDPARCCLLMTAVRVGGSEDCTYVGQRPGVSGRRPQGGRSRLLL
eukprot:3278689-Rhodomonas_salina.1